MFAEDRLAAESVFYNYYVFEQLGEPCYLILQAPVPADDPRFPSLAAELPAVNWQEREIQDWFGLEAIGHPNPRRVALHDNWPDVHPLCKSFPLRRALPPFAGERHVYRPTLGEGVFQIPVGPVHAGIIEPGHFNFAVAGEPILYLQLRMFYTHKGTEKLFEDMPIHRAVFLAESISGDSAFSHGTAFCQAIESASDIEVPSRARVMRTILLELERVCNHIGDIGAIATDVGFAVANAHAGRLRELVVRLNEGLDGKPLAARHGVRGRSPPRLVRRAARSAARYVAQVEREFESLVALVQASDSTRDRLEHTGILTPETAKALGIVGVAGRASGVDLDVRRDHPYAAYDRIRSMCRYIRREMFCTACWCAWTKSGNLFASCGPPPRTCPTGPALRSAATRAARPLRAQRRRRLARRNPALGSHRRRRPAGTLQDQRPIGE